MHTCAHMPIHFGGREGLGYIRYSVTSFKEKKMFHFFITSSEAKVVIYGKVQSYPYFLI